METTEYDYEAKSTDDLIRILERGTDMELFEPPQRYNHIGRAAHEIFRRRNECIALTALCEALRCCGAFHENPMEGVYTHSEEHLQLVIAGLFLRELKDVRSTVALLHAATTNPCQEVKRQATKACQRRPASILMEAYGQFKTEVSYEIAQRFSIPTPE